MKKIIAALSLCLLFAGAYELRAQVQQVPSLTSAQYAAMDQNDIFIIMFTVPGCKPCARAKLSVLAQLHQKYAQDENVHVFSLLVNNEKDAVPADGKHLYNTLGITAGPTFVVLHEGAEKYRHEGFSDAVSARLEQEIAAAVAREK